MVFLASSSCGTLQQVPSRTGTPTATDTSTPLSVTAVAIPPIESLQMIDGENGWAWAGSVKLLRTTDGGQTWIDRTPEGQVSPLGSFFLDAKTAWLSVYFAGSNRFGLLYTSDGGQIWTQYPYGGPQTAAGVATGLHFTDMRNGWAEDEDVAAGNVYFTLSGTVDGGETWAPIPITPLQPEIGLPPGTVHLCGLCEDRFYYDPGRMIIIYGDMLTMQPGGSVRIKVSFDLGKIWQTQILPLPEEDADLLVAPDQPVFYDEKNGFLPVHLVKMNSDGTTAYQHLALFRTQDGGASWSFLPGAPDNLSILPSPQIISPDIQNIFAWCGNVLCVTQDGAQTWQRVVSNLDFTQSDERSVATLDFLDASLGWVLMKENDATPLYKTIDGGRTWTKINPEIVASAQVITKVDTSLPTPTPIPTGTFEPTLTPNVAFDRNANAYRIRFAPEATWVEINDTISVNESKHYVLSAMRGQIMSVSIPQGPAFSVVVAGADQKSLTDPHNLHPFWRGTLPSTQDYFVTIESQVTAPFTLRIAINPPGQETQDFGFADMQYSVILGYPDEFAPTTVQAPIDNKGTPLLALTFIDPSFYYPITNLNEADVILTATAEPAIVSTCTEPLANRDETVSGNVTINNYTFTRTEFIGAAAGNRYDQISYRTVMDHKCFEVIFLIHSTDIGNYPPGAVVAFDRTALLKKFEAVLDTFGAK
jgi:photosystem II stability/assembly factor-like uncharacterized protein